MIQPNHNLLLKWLIIRNGAVGDTILLSPVLQAIRVQTPKAYIEVMGNLERVELLVGDGLADYAISFDQPGIESLFADEVDFPQHLHDYFNRFDGIVYYGQSNLESIQSKLRTNEKQFVITYPALPSNENIHITTHYLQAVEQRLNIDHDWIPKINLCEGDISWGKDWLKSRVKNWDEYYLIWIHAGAGSKNKQAPIDVFHHKIEELRKAHNLLIIITNGPADEEAVNTFVVSLTSSIPYIIAEGIRLRELAAVLSNCMEFIGNDSGITHLAAALGIPTTAIFVTSNPAVWKPLGGHVKVMKM